MASLYDSSTLTSAVQADPGTDKNGTHLGESTSQSLLPQEILDYILEFVDRETLCLCRLSSRTLLRRGTQLILRHTFVNKNRAAEMVEQFTQHTYKALAVRQVTFYSSHSCTEDVQLDQYTAIMSCLPNLQCFSIQQQTWRTPQARVVPFQGLSAVNKVTQLSFTGVNFPSPMHFLALVNAFPNLRKLSMDIIFWASDSSQSYDVMYPPFRPPSLQHLSARQALASITPHLLTRDTVQKLESVALEAAVMQSWWSIFENDVVYDNLRKITVVDLMFYRAISLPTLPKTPNLKTFALTGILIRTRNNRELDHVRYIVHNLQIVDSNSVEELFFEFYGVQEADLPLFSSAVWLPCLQQSKFDHLQRIVYTFVGRSLKGLEGEITARVMDAHESFEKRALIEIAVEDISV